MKKRTLFIVLCCFLLTGCVSAPQIIKKEVASFKEKDKDKEEIARLEQKVALVEQELQKGKTVPKLHELATLQLKLKKAEASLETLSHVKEIQPETAETHHLRASAYKIQGKKKEAQQEWEESLRLDPKLTKAEYNLGVLFYEMKQTDQAEIYWKKTIEIDATYSKAYYNLGVLEHNKGNLPAARAYYDKTLQYDSKHAKAYVNKGLIAAESNDMKGAIDSWNRAASLDPNNYFAHFNLALAQAMQESFDVAIQEWNLARDLNPSDPWLYFNLAMAYDKIGETKKAIQNLEEALKLNPDFEEAKTEWRSLMRQQNRTL